MMSLVKNILRFIISGRHNTFSFYFSAVFNYMKVLLANKFFFNKGGSETVFFKERDFLLSQGIDVVDFSIQDTKNLPSSYSDYFVSQKDYNDNEQSKLSKTKAALSMLYSSESINKMGKLIKHEKPDILHCHNIYHQLTPSILRVAQKHGVKTILTLHDYKVVCPVYNRLSNGEVCDRCLNGNFSNVLKHKCAGGSFSKSALLYAEAEIHKFLKSYDHIDKVIAVSRFMSDSVTQWRFPSERVEVIYNGVAVEKQTPIWQDGGYFLFLGRLSQEKGLETLAKAQAKTKARVVIAGTGPMENYLKQQYKDLTFIGHTYGDELKNIVAKARAVIVPSEWYENCSMSILESMAAGKPVIASRMGGNPELVSDEETGLLFEPGDVEALSKAMSKLASDSDLCRILGETSHKRVLDNFSIEQHNKALMNAYKSVFKSSQA